MFFTQIPNKKFAYSKNFDLFCELELMNPIDYHS